MLISFDTQINGIVFTTAEDITFTMHYGQYTIPAGFRSDGMSVPRLFWPLIGAPAGGVTLIPSIIHDFLYEAGITSRRAADRFYCRLLRQAGYPMWKTLAVYLGLRLGGWPAWRRCRRRNHA